MSLRAVIAADLRAGIEATRRSKQSTAVDTLPIWTPHEGPQRRFVESTCGEVLFGGAKGGGKSMSAIGLMLPWIDNPFFRGLVLRRETTGLKDIVDKAKRIFKTGVRIGVRPFRGACPEAKFIGFNGPSGGGVVHFPSGARIEFAHCKDRKDWARYQGQEFHIICFEELVQFLREQYDELRTCIRSGVPGLPRYLRATSNPGDHDDEGHAFVFRRYRYWLDPEATIPGRAPRVDAEGTTLPPAEPGEVLHIRKRADSDEEDVFLEPTGDTLSRTYIPALLDDNPTLMAEDPEYEKQLLGLDLVRRKQLRYGDWLAKPSAGTYFQRDWLGELLLRPVDAAVVRLRYWDRAAGEPTAKNPNPDWTVGTRWALRADGIAVVEDVVRKRLSPMKVKSLIKEIAEEDNKLPGGCMVCLEQDPAQAGKFEIAEYLQFLAPLPVIVAVKKPGDDKISWFRPCSRAAENGQVKAVRGQWNGQAFGELEAFPDGQFDDVVDTWGGGYTHLHLAAKGKLRKPTETSGSEHKDVSMHRGTGGF